MLRNLRRKTKGQSTAEYAILIALVVAAVIAMQTYAKRTLQARVKDASDYLVAAGNTEATVNLGTLFQYEPYYSNSSYNVSRTSDSYTDLKTNILVSMNEVSNVTRNAGGYDVKEYNYIRDSGN